MRYDGMKFAQGVTLVVLITVTTIGTMLLAAGPSSVFLSDTMPSPGDEKQVIRGEVVMIEGELQIQEDRSTNERDGYLIMDHLYVAKDVGEGAIQFDLNERTQVDDDVRVGDRVEILASKNGTALSIKKTE